MVEKQGVGAAAVAVARPELFVDGYFSSLIKSGKRPSHGYPANHLPEVAADASMEFIIEFSGLTVA